MLFHSMTFMIISRLPRGNDYGAAHFLFDAVDSDLMLLITIILSENTIVHNALPPRFRQVSTQHFGAWHLFQDSSYLRLIFFFDQPGPFTLRSTQGGSRCSNPDSCSNGQRIRSQQRPLR